MMMIMNEQKCDNFLKFARLKIFSYDEYEINVFQQLLKVLTKLIKKEMVFFVCNFEKCIIAIFLLLLDLHLLLFPLSNLLTFVLRQRIHFILSRKSNRAVVF